jgi:hypothetical protein
MIRFVRGAVLLTVLCLSIPMADSAHATTAVYLSEVEHALESDAVVLATVGEQRVDRDPTSGRLFTHTVVHVQKPLYGQAPVAFEVHQMGGRLGDEVLQLPGDATLTPGESVCLFVRQVDGFWYLTALQQSKYSIIPSLDGTLLERDLDVGLFLRSKGGPMRPFVDHSERSPMTLARLAIILHEVVPVPTPATDGGEQ